MMMWGMGCCGGWGWLGMLFGAFFWILVLYGLYLIFRSVAGGRGLPTGTSTRDDALAILKQRYARGEITREEYLNMKKDLEDAS
ncbi:MAG: SHOCT domain-containing protein [Candidatus Hydrothermae bacterium]|nr:SHOCT domain-containing protein [Candidatus Hydrothermae bacterium]